MKLMSSKGKDKKSVEHQYTITPAQLILLKCAAGCGQDANPQNAVPTGMLGLGRVIVHLCNGCESTRKEQKAKHDFKPRKGKG